jgi:hypothetical protein
MANQSNQSSQNQQSSSSSNQQNQGNQQSERKQAQGTSGQSGSQGKVDNVLYDVVTVLHKKSKGLEAYDKYMQDLQGRDEIRQIFETIRRNDEEAVQQLTDCLRQLMTQGGSQGKQGGRSEEAA